MARIETLTLPLVLRTPDQDERLIAAAFPHPLGLLVFECEWHRLAPGEGLRLLRGELTGEGPWRIGEARLRVVGCAGTDPHLQRALTDWLAATARPDYPPREQILEIARRFGARC